MLAKGVLDGLERLADVAARELVREDLPDPRLRAAPPSVPVLVDERADPGLDVRAARERDDVLDMAERPQDEEVLGLVKPSAFGSRGAPAGDAALDHRARGPRTQATRSHPLQRYASGSAEIPMSMAARWMTASWTPVAARPMSRSSTFPSVNATPCTGGAGSRMVTSRLPATASTTWRPTRPLGR